MEEILVTGDHFECVTCGHEWSKGSPGSEDESGEAALIVKDAHGNLLSSGDAVILIKDLKLKGGSGTLKGGTKIKGIRLVSGDHEIDCKVNGTGMMLKACFVKKA
jgi:protein PhnA